ncbi:BppU family phage baseplate upper protein [Enterococcus faecium]|uniref:BppU family phage baseplate upper protein n=1 Tax=Enterococcus faecium TaxID=1352 RepID=UPI0021F0A13C|nr:BppU family phage baseplate upper protein [Enterococcus faecium]EME3577043.1 BppU family phage baseplate upper protein [Enterococcus faecium]MCV6649831.1 BppU family phage baseplate upper protein [Enterococcus faecium]MDT2332719.1 BppU family phage baseplate upper protein [Enterococcus faecium]NTQ27288.1 BppU family phage baseplate upper protein [Enterococcus faecium]
MVYKMNESIIVIQAEATSPNRTNVVFWSHDRGTAKLRMKLVRKNGIPQSLPEGTTVPIRLMFLSSTAEDGYGKHDYLATIEDRMNGIVSIVLEDNILGYVGKVEGSVYIDFPNDRSLDTAGRFTFYIKRSPIDDSTPELEDYYFNGFSQTIDKIEKILADGKLEIDQKIAESETQIDAKLKDTNDKITKANQDVATLNTNIDKANDRIDQTNQQIGDLGKLKKMYSNSIDFGDYDYSGNPNIAPVINDENVKALNTATNVTNKVTYATANKIGNELTVGIGMIPWSRYDFPPLTVGKQYTLTIPIRINEDYTGDISKLFIRIRCTNPDGSVLVNTKLLPDTTPKEELVDISTTFTVPSTVQNSNNWYCQVGSSGDSDARGTVDIGYDVKLERGSTATPYQPNLLDAPYYLSKVALGENIADPTVKFPITLSGEALYAKNASEDFVLGETYTVTIKATKPASQTIRVYLTQKQFGVFKPVEGLTDTWVATVSITRLGENAKWVYLSQTPNTSLGPVQIDWLKIEKGDTRTPNISQFKYFGEGLKDSNNPNDYSWDVTPEYTEKGLNNTVSLTEPQSIEGLKNFEDGLQIAGKEVATVLEDTGWVNLTAINGHSWNKQGQIRRIGKLVMFRGSLKGSTLSTQDFCTIPEGFRPSNPTDNYEYQFLLPPQSSNTLDNGGMAYIRPNGVCGLPSFRGTVNLFLAPIQYYID